MAVVIEPKKGLEKLKSGGFNVMDVAKQPDGSEVITLTSAHYSEVYRFRVRNLYQENEEVFDGDTGLFKSTRDLH